VVAALKSDRPTLVAGSTWPSDEAVLLPAWVKLREIHPSARLIIAPHEPTPAHNEPMIQWASSAGLAVARVRDSNASTADVVVVDTVGMLGDLYALATAAFVGGGFHDAGLHSVLEPAAYGAPVCFGPRHHNARDAAILIAARGGAQVDSASSLVSVLAAWFDDAQRAAGAHAREVVERGLGAAERSAALVERLVRA
jgi:3-deoxy-D-manno-octulosonic-acid transferase